MAIQDIVNSINSINDKKIKIKEALVSKGVQSEGKLSKFPDEIKRISAGTNEQDLIRSILYKIKAIDWNDNATQLPDAFGKGITFNNVSLPNVVSDNSTKLFQLSTINNFSATKMTSCISIFGEANVTSFNLPKLESCTNFGYNGTIKTIYLPKLITLTNNIGGPETKIIVLPEITNLYDFGIQPSTDSERIYFGRNLKKFPILPNNYSVHKSELVIVLDTPQAIPVSPYTNATIDDYASRDGKVIISVLDSAYDSFKKSTDWNRYSQYIKKRSEPPADKLEFLKPYGLR